jgi:hypothetical protein
MRFDGEEKREGGDVLIVIDVGVWIMIRKINV